MKILRILILLCGLSIMGSAQVKEHTTELEGTVIDQAGANIPSTKIVLTNSTGKKFETVTNADGVYLLKIPSGTYTVEAEFTEHQAWEKFKIEKYEIASTKRMTLDISLRIDEEFTKRQGDRWTSEPIKTKKKP